MPSNTYPTPLDYKLKPQQIVAEKDISKFSYYQSALMFVDANRFNPYGIVIGDDGYFWVTQLKDHAKFLKKGYIGV